MHCPLQNCCPLIYSLLKLLTGLARAAFMAWKPTVSIAIKVTAVTAIMKTAGPISTRYAKPLSHLLINKYASGDAINTAIKRESRVK